MRGNTAQAVIGRCHRRLLARSKRGKRRLDPRPSRIAMDVRKERLDPIPGMPPDMINQPPGCPFYPRCTFRQPRNEKEMPPLLAVEAGHEVACWVDVRTAPQHAIEDETAIRVGTE